MSATNRGKETDFLSISKRAKGRDRYNARRSARALHRQVESIGLMVIAGWPRRGWQAKVARLMGVHRSTICRDFRPIKGAAQLGITVKEFEADRRLGWRLDRRQRLGLRW